MIADTDRYRTGSHRHKSISHIDPQIKIWEEVKKRRQRKVKAKMVGQMADTAMRTLSLGMVPKPETSQRTIQSQQNTAVPGQPNVLFEETTV